MDLKELDKRFGTSGNHGGLRNTKKIKSYDLIFFNARSRIRTRGLLVRSQTLYPAELCAHSAQNRNRTSDTRIFSPLLYQLSYLGIQYSINAGDRDRTGTVVLGPQDFKSCASASFATPAEGPKHADEGTRTDNLLITNQLLCQLSHIGVLLIRNI